MLAQTAAAVRADKSAYIAGEPITILGQGFSPLEEVTLQVTHADGTAEAGMGHEPWLVTADAVGSFSQSWSIDIGDTNGPGFVITAEGVWSGPVTPTALVRIATLATDKPAYPPGDTAAIAGLPFVPNEPVDLRVVHDDSTAEGGLALDEQLITADQSGGIASTFSMPAANPGDSSLLVTATGTLSGIVASSGPTPLGPQPCPTNLGSCTSNDLVTWVVDAVPVGGDSCTDPDDTIQLDLTIGFISNANQRYDLGLFLATSGPVNNGTACVGAVAPIGGGDTPTLPNQTVFKDLDPNHPPYALDTCGDVDTKPEFVNWTLRTTVDCVPDENNSLVVQACRVWENNANHSGTCVDLTSAGTGLEVRL